MRCLQSNFLAAGLLVHCVGMGSYIAHARNPASATPASLRDGSFVLGLLACEYAQHGCQQPVCMHGTCPETVAPSPDSAKDADAASMQRICFIAPDTGNCVQQTLRVFFRNPRSDVALMHPINSRVTYCMHTHRHDKQCLLKQSDR